jgi:26S proteasome regulatory subunit N2
MGIGLLMAGSGNKDIFEELYAYALETTHEKIIRAIALALSALCFDQEENMDALIDKLLLE